MESKELGKTLAIEIAKPTVDLSQDYAELSIDALIDNPVLKEVPLVKTVVALGKTAIALREWHFVKKLLAFLKELHSGDRASQKANEFKQRLSSDEAFRNKVTEHILVIVDRYITVDKAKILGHLFKAHVNGEFPWDDFVCLSIILEALQPQAFKTLEDLAAHEPRFTSHSNAPPEEALLFAAGIGTRYGTGFRVTPLGVQLYDHGIRPYLKSTQR